MSERAGRDAGLYYGWAVVAAAALMMAATWGISQGTFGVLVKPLTEDTGWSRTAASAAFSIHLAVSFVLGVFWGWLSDHWGVRRVLVFSGALMGLGMFLSGTVHALWQLYVFFGLIGGAGLGGATGPLTAIATRWFERRRGLAIGIVFGGSSVGTATLAILAEFLISHQGWRFAFQALSFLIWGLFIVTVMFLREPSERSRATSSPGAAGREEQGQGGRATAQAAVPLSLAVRTRFFWLLFGMMVMSTLIFFLVLVHLVPRAIDIGVASSRAVTVFTATSILTMVGTLGGGSLGRPVRASGRLHHGNDPVRFGPGVALGSHEALDALPVRRDLWAWERCVESPGAGASRPNVRHQVHGGDLGRSPARSRHRGVPLDLSWPGPSSTLLRAIGLPLLPAPALPAWESCSAFCCPECLEPLSRGAPRVSPNPPREGVWLAS